MKKLLQLNRKTGIESRSSIHTYLEGFGAEVEPPSISELDIYFREFGVDLAVNACKKALEEWGGDKNELTHTIAVTCTNQGNPGYDRLVGQALGLRDDIDSTLMHGVGCAGGLSIMRLAAQIASGATARDKPARILAFACELCTTNLRNELSAAEISSSHDVGIASVLFSDAAAAFVLCNNLGLGKEANPLFELVEWSTTAIPNSEKSMSFLADTGGQFFSEVASTVTDHRHRLSYYHNPRRCNPNDGSFGANVS